MSISEASVRLILQETQELVIGLRRLEEQMARRVGHTRATWRVLVAAADNDQTVPQLARRLGVKRQSVQRIADRLVEGGWARYQTNPHHRRSPLVHLTERGESTLESLQRALTDWESDLGEELENEELETALYVLRSLRATW